MHNGLDQSGCRYRSAASQHWACWTVMIKKKHVRAYVMNIKKARTALPEKELNAKHKKRHERAYAQKRHERAKCTNVLMGKIKKGTNEQKARTCLCAK